MLLYLYKDSFVDLGELRDDVMSVKWNYSLQDFFRANVKNIEDFSKIIIEESFINYVDYDKRLNTEKIIIIAADNNYQKIYHQGCKTIASLEEPITTLNKILYSPALNIIDIQEDEIFKLEKIDTAQEIEKQKTTTIDSKEREEKKSKNSEDVAEEIIPEEREKTENTKLRLITILLVVGGLISSLLLLYISYKF